MVDESADTRNQARPACRSSQRQPQRWFAKMVSGTSSTAGAQKKPAKVVVAPLAWLTASGKWILTKKAYRQWVENRIVDAYDQYFPSLSAGHVWLCRWIVVRCVILIVADLLREPLAWLKEFFSGGDSGKGV